MSDLRDLLQHESERYPSLATDMIDRIAKRAIRRQRNRKLAAIGVAVVISVGSIAALARGFSEKGGGPATTPPHPTSSPSLTPTPTLTITNVHWIAAPGFYKVIGTLTNSGPDPTGASIVCVLIDASHSSSSLITRAVSYLEPGPGIQVSIGGTSFAQPVSASCTVSAQAAGVSPTPTVAPKPTFFPDKIAFFDRLHGIVVGQFGPSCYGAGCQGWIETTLDGGVTWRVTAKFPKPVSSVAISDNEAWATLDGCGKCSWSSGLLHSLDRGRTWTLVSTADIGLPSFATATSGWALRYANAKDAANNIAPGVTLTGDGGRTWGPPIDACKKVGWARAEEVQALSPTRLFVACMGQPGAGSQPKAIVESWDAGATWTIVDDASAMGLNPLAPANGLSGGGYFKGMFFLPDGHGWLWMDRGTLYTTSDAAASWHIDGNILKPEINWMGSAWFISSTEGFAMLSQTHWQLIHTTDGLHWRVVYTWESKA